MKKNKYSNWYYQLIDKRKKETPTGYSEKHHIIPKCLGGTDEYDNIVRLTGREHFIAHLLLTKMYDGEAKRNLYWAWHRMAFSSLTVERRRSKAYEINRKRWSKYLKENHHAHRDQQYLEKLSKIVYEHWNDNDERRVATGKIFKQSHDDRKEKDPTKYYTTQRKNASLGGIASKEKNALKLEYKGKIYLGWNDLKKYTGVSKHLYKKYYMNGIDPEFRIGSDGPIPTTIG